VLSAEETRRCGESESPVFKDPDLKALYSEGTIEELIGPIQSGQEATAYRARGESGRVAVKIHKERQHCGFQRRARYRAGREMRDRRLRRAPWHGSDTGRVEEQTLWTAKEYMQNPLVAGEARGNRLPADDRNRPTPEPGADLRSRSALSLRLFRPPRHPSGPAAAEDAVCRQASGVGQAIAVQRGRCRSGKNALVNDARLRVILKVLRRWRGCSSAPPPASILWTTPMKSLFAALLTSTLLIAGTTAAGAVSLCFIDGDGAEWNLELNNDNMIQGTVQIPMPECAAGAVIGHWAYGDRDYEMHWMVRENLEACVPFATFAGSYRFLGGPGEAQVIALDAVKDMPLLPCESGAAADGGAVEQEAVAAWWQR
jgi:hypothetical protein